MRAKNYNYQIPEEESQIHGSRCNTLKHGETISQNKHCHDFWWLLLTVWIGKQQHKSNSLDLKLVRAKKVCTIFLKQKLFCIIVHYHLVFTIVVLYLWIDTNFLSTFPCFRARKQDNPSWHLNSKNSAKVRFLWKTSKWNIPNELLT